MVFPDQQKSWSVPLSKKLTAVSGHDQVSSGIQVLKLLCHSLGESCHQLCHHPNRKVL